MANWQKENDTGAFESENHRTELGARHPIHCIAAIMDYDTPQNKLAQQLDRLLYPLSFQQSNLTLNHIICYIYIRYLYIIYNMFMYI